MLKAVIRDSDVDCPAFQRKMCGICLQEILPWETVRVMQVETYGNKWTFT